MHNIDLHFLTGYLRPTTLAAIVADCREAAAAKGESPETATQLEIIAACAETAGGLNVGAREFARMVAKAI